jgi:FSR family fosmidomycin resistance protein-like MFS transporter
LSASRAAASYHATTTAFSVLAAISFCHLLNDMMQSLLPAIYPILKDNYGLTFGQIGFLTFKFQVTASLLQPVIGFLIERFVVAVRAAQLHLFLCLAAVAVGTLAGGALGDRFGRKFVIWLSIFGVLPFTLALPYANLFWTGVLSVPIGLILASALPAIVVYGQELVPFRVGTVAGLFFGLAFGLGGIGAALVGQIADVTGVQFVFKLCSFLPLLGLLTAFLPQVATTTGAPGKA